MVGVEIVCYRIIVRRCGYDNEVCVAICFCTIECGGQVKSLFSEIFFNVVILNRGNAVV